MHDVAVLHNIVFALDAQLAGFAHCSLRAVFDVVVILYHLGADKALLEVGVDYAGTLRSLPALVICPCLNLHLACGDECLEVKQGIGFLYQTVYAALFEAKLVEEHLLVFVCLKACYVFLCLACYNEHLGAFGLCHLLNAAAVVVAGLGRCLVDVANIQHGLSRQQEQVACGVLLFLAVKLNHACVLALFEHFLVCLEHPYFYFCLLVSGGCHLLLPAQASLYGLEVLQLQLGVDDFLVAYRVYAAVNVSDVVVVEAAQHVYDGVGFAYVSEELVAQTFALAGTLYESGNVHNLAGCGHNASRMYNLGELCEAFVGHGYHADVRFDGAKRKVGCLCLRARQAVENRRLAHIRQSYYTTF